MEPITSNDFLNSVLETEAWKEVSQSGSLSMTMIEKFADRLDWEEVSGNSNVIWTVEGINKFANKIHWDEFSRSCPENFLSESTLQKFAPKWIGRRFPIETTSTTTGVCSKSLLTR